MKKIKLNHDNVRSLLLFLEEAENNSSRKEDELISFASQNHISKDELIYIIQKLKEAGYIKANITYASSKVYWFSVDSITWNGHEYLENIRDPKIWKYVKKSTSKLASVSLSVIGSLAKDTIIKVLSGEITIS